MEENYTKKNLREENSLAEKFVSLANLKSFYENIDENEENLNAESFESLRTFSFFCFNSADGKFVQRKFSMTREKEMQKIKKKCATKIASQEIENNKKTSQTDEEKENIL